MPAKITERAWARFDASYNRGPNDSCWEWSGAINEWGYGITSWRRLAHREAFARAHGPIPDGLCVLHHCDNRKCVNPSHLWLGTRRDNTADMDAKGRRKSGTLGRPGRRGEAHHLAKLSWPIVRDMRRRASEGESAKQLAERFGVFHQHVRKILRGERWKEES